MATKRTPKTLYDMFWPKGFEDIATPNQLRQAYLIFHQIQDNSDVMKFVAFWRCPNCDFTLHNASIFDNDTTVECPHCNEKLTINYNQQSDDIIDYIRCYINQHCNIMILPSGTTITNQLENMHLHKTIDGNYLRTIIRPQRREG